MVRWSQSSAQVPLIQEAEGREVELEEEEEEKRVQVQVVEEAVDLE